MLNVISRSPSDIQPVLDAIAETAQRLCQSEHVFIMTRKGERFHLSASGGASPEQVKFLSENPFAITRGSITGRVAFEGRTIQVADVLADPEYTKNVDGHRGFRTTLGIPLLREGMVTGVIVLTRSLVQPFSDKQIELVETFADQAVIAIENVAAVRGGAGADRGAAGIARVPDRDERRAQRHQPLAVAAATRPRRHRRDRSTLCEAEYA